MTANVPKALLVVAVRPNFIKMKPVLDALETAGIECHLVHTGQHYDKNLSDVFFQDLGMRQPDISLGTGSGSYAQQIADVMTAFEKVVNSVQPDLVVVVGDVNSTLACALVGARSGAVVAHVEAGLRSRDWDMPEEINRVVTDRVSDLLLCPSDDAKINLQKEGYRDDQIHVVGNMMIDSLQNNLSRAKSRTVVADLGLTDKQYAVATIHRPSNVDESDVLDSLMGTLISISESIPVVVPVHPRTKASIEANQSLQERIKEAGKNLLCVEPLGYLDFLCLQANARLVLTDSGGIQEETTALGVPCLTLRNNTERPITIHCGTNQLVGLEKAAILNAVKHILDSGVEKRCPELWDGKAGVRCATVIKNRLNQAKDALRPTDIISEESR